MKPMSVPPPSAHMSALERLDIVRQYGRIGFWERDLPGDTGYWDPQLFVIFGLPVRNVPPSRTEVLARIHPADAERFRETWNASLATDVVNTVTYRIMRHDGEVRMAQSIWRVTTLGGDRRRALGMVVDVTDSWEMARRIDGLSAQLGVAQSMLGAGILRLDLDTGLCHFDARAAEIYGLGATPRPMTLEQSREYILPEDRGVIRDALTTILRSGGSSDSVGRIRRADGEIRMIWARRRVECDADGRPVRVFSVLIDTTDEQERELKALDEARWMRYATEAGRIGLWQWDIERNTTEWSPTTHLLFGIATDTETSEDVFWQQVHPEDRAALAAQELAAIEGTTETLESQFRIIREGQIAHIMSRARILRDEHGQAKRIIGINADITDRVEAEATLKQTQARLQLATRGAGIGIWEHDFATDTSLWDSRTREIYGVAPDAPINRAQWRARIHPLDAIRVVQARDNAAAQGDRFDTEFRIVMDDGDVRQIVERGVIIRQADGGVAKVIGIVIDITPERSAQTKAREAIEQLGLAAEAVGLGSWEVDLTSGEIRMDARMYALFGYARPPAASARMVWRRAIPPRERRLAIDAVRRIGRARAPFSHEFRIRWPDGQLHILMLRGQVLSDEFNQPRKFAGVAWDITDQLRAQTVFREKEAAERASRAKSEFLSRMSHELRTPLNAILGFTQLIRLDPGAVSTTSRLDRIEAAGQHLLQLVNEVLDLSRIEAGQVKLSLEAIDLSALARDAIEIIAPQALARELSVHCLANEPAFVHADRIRLQQVLLNLLSNAVKYNQPRGSVVVGVRQHAAHIALYVRDTGWGISDDQIAHLFEPYNRLGQEAAAIEGTGLGLQIARNLIDQMGGQLSVRSALGQGSEFTVLLPHARSAQAPAPSAASPAHEASARIRHDVSGSVVYVEDNPSNVQLVTQYLALRPQVRLWCAANVAQGLAISRIVQPDLLLLDMRLPDGTGFVLYEQLRDLMRRGKLASAPCVAVSANAMPDEIQRALSEGFADYWTKPIALGAFLDGIDRLLQGRPKNT